MVKTDEFVKYITQQLVTYIDTPRDVKRERRQLKKQARSMEKWTERWFGLIPFSLQMYVDQHRRKK
ncbi:YqzE family protein [Paenibacillus sp. J2TS4]|uniref:YqzE family protein n=1 Tax=Paenibacillus sp. J2TS4 TaxID=2807194 RepID=UPI001B1A9F3D|nr:YqzE family protein [Paenibacillus sp. J2TS4]GIP33981.1 hypothetical protein J2TS4_31910 [Paenibacillus sp. J2TS4]